MLKIEDLEEIKEWLRIDNDEEDRQLSSLILSARAIIKSATGVTREDVEENIDALNLYKMIEKLEVSMIYEGSLKDTTNKGLIALYMQLEGSVLNDKM